jgi:ABC-type multidrug transport system permease subunit
MNKRPIIILCLLAIVLSPMFGYLCAKVASTEVGVCSGIALGLTAMFCGIVTYLNH